MDDMFVVIISYFKFIIRYTFPLIVSDIAGMTEQLTRMPRMQEVESLNPRPGKS